MRKKTFYELLRFSLGITDKMETPLTDADWTALLQLADEQALMGILAQGMARLPKELRPKERQTLFTWVAAGEMIRQTNKEVCEHSVALARQLERDGYDCCLLKGQGLALLYPDAGVRMSGDIDIWVTKNGQPAPASEVIAYVRSHAEGHGEAVYHHIEYGTYEGTEAEIHYRPSFMQSPVYNLRLQRYFASQLKTQFAHRVEMAGDSICVPTTAFNRIFLLAHIGHHIIQQGIGLRQLVDYYYVLRQGASEEERAADRQLLKQLGLEHVAGAVMYVMKKLFWVDDQLLLVAPDKRRGAFLINEMMEGGNFGHYDHRVSEFARNSRLGRNIERLRRDWRCMRLFPSESLWEPVFRLWHFFWRAMH